MRRLFFSVTLLLSMTAQAYDFKGVRTQHILPAYQQMHKAAQSLLEASVGQCQKTAPANDFLKSHFITFNNYWQSVQHIRTGPIEPFNRHMRIEMWPDKRGKVGKHLARIFADKRHLKPDFEMAKASVALQGLPALERLIFSNKSLDNSGCELLKKISRNLIKISDDLAFDWNDATGSYAVFFDKAGPDSLLYETETLLATELVNNLTTQLEFIVTQKFDKPLGESAARAKSKRAEFWRSQQSIPSLVRNLESLKTFFQLTFATELNDEPLNQKINAAFDKAITATNKIDGPLYEAVKNPQRRQPVITARHLTEELYLTVLNNVPSKLGLTLSFNSLDGD